MNAPIRPPMPTRQSVATLEAVRNAAGVFDIDAWHVMEERDNALIADEILHGAGSSKFVYSFDLGGTTVTGISVIGARHLAAHYGGMKHRLVASVQKTGELFTFTSYPTPGMPMHVSCSLIPELGDQPDFYGAIAEITDVKTGNTIQVERRENRFERTRRGDEYERPHYATIAQSKAYRNGILNMIPQDVQLGWKIEMLKLGKAVTITEGVLEVKRAGVLRYSAAKAIPVDRRAVEALTLDQISGLSEAAKTDLQQFTKAAMALGVLVMQQPAEPPPQLEPPPAARQSAPQAPSGTAAAAAASPGPGTPPAPAAASSTAEPEPALQFIDEFGELEGEPFEDPVAYANALASRWERTSNREALIENNEHAIQEASAASREADAILAPLLGLVPPTSPAAASPSGPAPIPLVTGRGGKPDVPAYVKAVEAELAQITDGAGLTAWIKRNAPTYGALSSVGSLRVGQAIAVRHGALGISWSDPEKAPPADEHTRIADGLIEDVRRCQTVNDLDTMALNGAVKARLDRLQQDAPHELARVRAAAKERRQELIELLPEGDV